MTPLLRSALQDAIFGSANFSCIACDARGVIQIFNVGAERMLGYSAEDVVNLVTPADISDAHEMAARAAALSLEFDRAIQPGFEALVFKAERAIEDIYELTLVRKDGSRLPAMLSVTALRDSLDQVIGYLLISTDNTTRKGVEQALQDTHAALEGAKAVLGSAQVLASEMPPPSAEQKVSINQILHAGWYLLRLINEILDLSMIESGNAMPRDVERGLLAGFFRYLTKPIQVEAFMAALDQALQLADAAVPTRPPTEDCA